MIREVTNACAIVASREERDGLIRARVASTNILGGKKRYLKTLLQSPSSEVQS